MNASTPTDDASARPALPVEITRLLAVEAAALVVDPGRHTIAAANAAAERLLKLRGGYPQPLDPAMPAWRSIADGLRGTAGGDRQHLLLLWTPAGPATLCAHISRLTHQDRALVLLTEARPRPPRPGNGSPDAAAPDDMATLREIARRIKEGTAALAAAKPASPAVHAAAVTPQPAKTAPPPLDFRQAEPAGAADKGADLATAEGVRPTRPSSVALSRLAHELRTPLSAIVSLAEVMRDEQLGPMHNPRYRAYAADIHDSAQHTLDLVAAMIADSIPEPDGAPDTPSAPRIERAPIDLNQVCAGSTSAMQPIAARGGVELAIEVDEHLPPLSADRRAVRQIVLNLLSNALRHTPPGGSILLSTARRPDGTTALSVADTGTGMRQAEIARALAKTQADDQPRRLRIAGEKAGMGIGLPLVRELIEAHGGKLLIDSITGQGTTVTALFPAGTPS